MVILLCRVLTLGVLYGISIFALIGGVAMIVITMGMVVNDYWMGATSNGYIRYGVKRHYM